MWGGVLDWVMLAACGLSGGAVAVHAGAGMLFVMIFVAVGWQGLEPAAFDVTVGERFYGEAMGVAAAMVAITLLV